MTQPVFIAGAEVGDGVAIRIRDITVTSIATASGHDSSPEGFCLGDPYVAGRCATCDTVWRSPAQRNPLRHTECAHHWPRSRDCRKPRQSPCKRKQTKPGTLVWQTRNRQPAGPVWLNPETEISAPEIRDAHEISGQLL